MARVLVVLALLIAATASAFVAPANHDVSSPAVFTRIVEGLSVLQRFPTLVANDHGAAMSMAKAKEIENNKVKDEKEEKNAEKKHSKPVTKQIQKAMRQLASFQATLRKRLVKAKQRLDKGTVASTDDDILTKLDEAIALIDLHFASKSKTKSLLLKSATSVAAEQKDLVLSLTDIQTLIDEIHQCLEVKKALDNGIVMPFFHTLLLPETFLNNRRSWNKVEKGEMDEGKELELGEVGENLSAVVVVDENGNERGARAIIDEGLVGRWKFSQLQTAFAVNLVNADAEMLGEDIECTKLTLPPPVEIDPKDESYDLLTRSESRGVVANTFHTFAQEAKGGSVAAITGSPGIGKSWTLFYALQQALHYDGATVLFFFQKSDDAVMYLRRNNKIYAWYSKGISVARSSLFSRSDILVLLDPKEAKQAGANFNVGKQNVLYAASNNEGHFKNSAEKVNGNIRFYLGPPMDSELYVILAQLNPKLMPSDIEKRKKNVGNLIRYIADEDKYNLRIQATDAAVKECAEDTAKLQRALDMDGISVGDRTIPGTLFQVLPERPDHQTSIGYDGQNVMYRELVVLAANDEVRNAIVKAGRKMILTYWGKVDGAEFAKMGAEAENLFIEDLTNIEGMVMKRFLQTSGKTKKGEESLLMVPSGMEIKKNVQFSQICSDVLMKSNVVAKVVKGFPLIDVAGPGRKLYQVTVSRSHSMSPDAMASICKELGYVGDSGKIIPAADAVPIVEFYWVVPEGIAETWKAKAPYSYQKKLNPMLHTFLKTHVKQYVLPMTYEIPATFEQHMADSSKTAKK